MKATLPVLVLLLVLVGVMPLCSRAADEPTGDAIPEKNPVLLLYGLDDNAHTMQPLMADLSEHGREVTCLSLVPNNGDATIEELAEQFREFVDLNYPEQPIDLVCFSMGGIVGRYYLQRLGGLDRVQHFITISSPHHGTLTGYLRHNRGGRELRPHSALLDDMNRDSDSLAQLKVTTIWSPFDLMIVPCWSSRLPFGRQVIVPVLAHPLIQRDRRVFAAVEKALEK